MILHRWTPGQTAHNGIEHADGALLRALLSRLGCRHAVLQVHERLPQAALLECQTATLIASRTALGPKCRTRTVFNPQILLLTRAALLSERRLESLCCLLFAFPAKPGLPVQCLLTAQGLFPHESADLLLDCFTIPDLLFEYRLRIHQLLSQQVVCLDALLLCPLHPLCALRNPRRQLGPLGTPLGALLAKLLTIGQHLLLDLKGSLLPLLDVSKRSLHKADARPCSIATLFATSNGLAQRVRITLQCCYRQPRLLDLILQLPEAFAGDTRITTKLTDHRFRDLDALCTPCTALAH
mmetsp:Transcript_75945/g.191116  ORF Transcript_75945/g.191116 Transcript_75945/m.191116 type:complete len:296 (+) Transcript_75945:116-1003(+)